MNSKIKVLLIAFFLFSSILLIFTPSTLALYTATDDFEDDVVDTSPTSTWYTYAIGAHSGIYMNVSEVGIYSKAYKIADGGDTGANEGWFNFTAPTHESPRFMNFSFMTNVTAKSYWFINNGSIASYIGGLAINQNANKVSVYHSPASYTDLYTYQTYTWYDASFEFNWTGQTFQVTSNGTTSAWLGFDTPESNMTGFKMRDASDGAVFYMDNLSFYQLSGGGGPGPAPSGPTFNCESTGHEDGKWEFTEYAQGGTLDEDWWRDYANDTYWYVKDRSGTWMSNYTLSHWNKIGIAGLNATMLNASGMNRTGVLMNIHHNGTEGSNVTMGFIIGNWSDRFYYVGAGEHSAYWLYYNGTAYHDVYNMMTGGWSMINITQGINETVTNWWDFAPPGVYESGGEALPYYWEIAPTYTNGSWLKMIYSGLCDQLQFKSWGDPTLESLFSEPAGWIIDQNLSSDILDADLFCNGIAVWNPDGDKISADFDLINYFQENYSKTAPEEPYPLGKPYMEFPVYNATVYSENLINFLDMSEGGDFLSEENIGYLINITNMTVKNSRPYVPHDTLDNSPWDQNDTIRYHTATLTNCTELGLPYNNYLWIFIHDTTDGWGASATHTGSAFVGINVDGDTTWDANDRAYYITTGGIHWEWHGDDWVPEFNINATAWYSIRNAYNNIYRYWNHSHYSFFIPLSQLIKSGGEPLNATDLFNISVFTWASYDDHIAFWENYNESNCTGMFSENHDLAKNRQLNVTYLLDEEGSLPIEGDNLKYWGIGEITGLLESEEYVYNMTVEKTVNRSTVPSNHLYVQINYSVWINNTGNGNLTDIYVNETWYDCGCSDYNWSLVDTNIAMEDITWWNASCFWTIHDGDIEPLGVGESWHIWYVVNVTNCTGENLTGRMYNNVTANATGVPGTRSDSVSTWLGTYVTRVCVSYTTDMTDVTGISNNVFAMVGLLLIIASILAIIGVMYLYQRT